MADLETAEEFANEMRNCAEVGMDGELLFERELAVGQIEARDAAVRLVLLDELESWLTERKVYEHARSLPDQMIAAVRGKYTKG